MKATFENTVDILVKAYLNNTLKHGDCKACAVGNILGGSPLWALLFCTANETGEQHFNPSWNNHASSTLNLRKFRAIAVKEVEDSGYTKIELAKVEYAFETAPRGDSADERMFNGLMAVVDVLADIHGIDLKAKEEAKALFVRV